MVTARIPLFRNTVIKKGGYNTKRSLASSFKNEKKTRGLSLESANMDMLHVRKRISHRTFVCGFTPKLTPFSTVVSYSKNQLFKVLSYIPTYLSRLLRKKKLLSPPFDTLLRDAARRLIHHRTKPRLAFLISNHIKKIIHSKPVLNCFGRSDLAFHMPPQSSIVS